MKNRRTGMTNRRTETAPRCSREILSHREKRGADVLFLMRLGGVPRCDSEMRMGGLRLSQMLQGQRIRLSVIELVQSELEDVVGGDSIEKGQAGTHFHGVNATQYFSGLFRFVVK